MPRHGPHALLRSTLQTFGSAAVPTLINALASENILVRVQVTQILGHIGPDASDAVHTLEQALDDPDAEVRREAKKALERIRGER